MKDMNYEITHIHISKLSVVWRKSQRQYNEAWAKQIADEFDPDKFEHISVTQPNGAGVYHIIDGQHRKGGAEIALGQDQKLPCRIIAEADPSRAAEIFLGINSGRKVIKPVAGFLVAVEARRELECSINGVIKSAGYRVTDQTNADNAVSAVGALRSVYNNYGAKILLHTLQLCRLLWGSDPRGVSAYIIRGLGMFMNEFGDHVETTHLRKVIHDQYKSPNNFVEAARLESEKSSERLDIAMSELVRAKYNKRMREGKKLKRKE